MLSRMFQCLAVTVALVLAGCAGPALSSRGGSARFWPSTWPVGAAPLRGGPAAWGGKAVPAGWPDLSSSHDVLAPFLACTSLSEFIQLQRGVDMARLVEELDAWSAIRLGALGPLRAGADVLDRKRAEFIVTATEQYGPPRAEVFTLFIVNTAFTDELREVLGLLARDKRLKQTLARMPAVLAALELRGLHLSQYADRPERRSDMLRGVGRFADQALCSTQLCEGARGMTLSAQVGQLPEPYQQVFHEVESALMVDAFQPGNVALRSADALTFGVPLGFYSLLAGTCHGVSELAQGHGEEAARELSAAAVFVGLYAGGKALRWSSEAAAGPGTRGLARVRVREVLLPELGFEGLPALVERLLARLGNSGLLQLAKYLQADREAALLVYEGGEPAAVGLYEAKGDVAGARALMAKAPRERPGGSLPKAASPAAAAPEAGPGEWVQVNTSMPTESRVYQSWISRRPPGWGYVVKNVKMPDGEITDVEFDGFDGKELQECKANYNQFLDPHRPGFFESWFEKSQKGPGGMVEQAERQVEAAKDLPVRWYVKQLEASEAIRTLLQKNRLDMVEVIYKPLTPSLER